MEYGDVSSTVTGAELVLQLGKLEWDVLRFADCTDVSCSAGGAEAFPYGVEDGHLSDDEEGRDKVKEKKKKLKKKKKEVILQLEY